MSQAVPIVKLATALLAASCAGVETGLAGRLSAFAASHEPHTVAIAYLDLESGHQATVNGDVLLHAASTMKVPVMIELFRQADAGALDLDAALPLRNEFRSIVDGSAYSLSADDDSDRELYAKVGSSVRVRELLRRMIDASSNLATNVLIELVGAENVQRTIEALGTEKMQVLRGVEDQKAYDAGLSNSATARDLMVVMAAIADDSAASPQSCRAMREILFGQKFNDMIPKGLPADARVAHKTGEITRIHHDAAIVYPKDASPYVLVVLTKGIEDRSESAQVGAAAAGLVHDHR